MIGAIRLLTKLIVGTVWKYSVAIVALLTAWGVLSYVSELLTGHSLSFARWLLYIFFARLVFETKAVIFMPFEERLDILEQKLDTLDTAARVQRLMIRMNKVRIIEPVESDEVVEVCAGTGGK